MRVIENSYAHNYAINNNIQYGKMWSRDHMYLCIKNEFKDYSVLFLNQIRSARKTIAEFVIYCSFSDSCVQLSGKEKEATMSRTIQKNTQRKGEQYNGNIKRIIRKFIGKNRS